MWAKVVFFWLTGRWDFLHQKNYLRNSDGGVWSSVASRGPSACFVIVELFCYSLVEALPRLALGMVLGSKLGIVTEWIESEYHEDHYESYWYLSPRDATHVANVRKRQAIASSDNQPMRKWTDVRQARIAG